jgi:hypothetical protein
MKCLEKNVFVFAYLTPTAIAIRFFLLLTKTFHGECRLWMDNHLPKNAVSRFRQISSTLMILEIFSLPGIKL